MIKRYTDDKLWDEDINPIIVDQHGRRGIVSEIRDYSRGPGLFARPEGVDYLVHGIMPGIGPATFISATWWSKQIDGSYRGCWADSPLNTELIAHLEPDSPRA